MSLSRKIKNLEEIALIIPELKKDGKKIVLCHGVFDLMHLGHIRHFYAAKKAPGDILVVTITPDKYVNKGPGRPVFTEALRAEAIAALESVDYVAINLWPDAVLTIKALKPDIYVKGKDYADITKDETGGIILEKEAAALVGCEIRFTDEITFSSSSLLNAYFDIYPEKVQSFLKEFRKRYSADGVIEALKELKDLNVLVIGDTILDKYSFVNPIGKPPKGNHIAAELLSEETHAGGVLACANHLANFCDKVDLVTAIGNDGKEEFIRSHLKPNIIPYLGYYDNAPTIIKRRFVDNAFMSKLFEVYEIDSKPSPKLEKQIIDLLSEIIFSKLKIYDLILVLDYGHGLLTPALIDFICDRKEFLAVNAQTNTANMGYNPITKYPRANYFCLDDKELRLAFHEKYGEIGNLIKQLSSRVSLPGAVTITQGHLGAVTYDIKNDSFFEVPVLSQKVVDTTGAGDAFLALTGPCVAKEFPMELVAFIGNVAGALAVGVLGNRSSIEAAPLYKFITALLK